MCAADAEKQGVKDYWEARSCGEVYMCNEASDPYAEFRELRYVLIPEIPATADFPSGRDKDVLEIGLGVGTDFSNWLKHAPKSLTGIDLTERALSHTRAHIAHLKLGMDNVTLLQGDAESMPFADEQFDIIYSWGVLHHSPDTPKAIAEVYRVLRTGGRACIMIYHSPSLVGIMLWVRYALLKGKPLRSLSDIYASHLESPGTKAYSCKQARALFAAFTHVTVRVDLTHGDLLEGVVGERHGVKAVDWLRRFWPRWLLRKIAKPLGSNLVVIAYK